MAESASRGNGQSDISWDVAIVGGGPAGATAATLLRKYAPDLRVLILEKERFPRDHIGESQLPVISFVLHEMGVWDAVEAAGFPIKLGASLTWGRDGESWDFDFYPAEEFRDEPRPAKYEGQRRSTAFQVDRAIYDDILLRHAASLGATVREGALVREVLREGDAVAGLRLDTGEVIRARWYIDASGTVGLFRRAFDLEVEAPLELRNIAIWDYWENADWAVKIGVGGTRIQVRSLPYGWLWFIPLGPTRTSLGLVCPAEYYKSTGKSPDEIYHESIQAEPSIAALVGNATVRGRTETTRDWSLLAERLVGANWFLVGEAAGFADPILSAGMTLAHMSAREAAYVILSLHRGEHDPRWLRQWYDEKNRTNIRQHIRFAQFWYASNGCFTELKENCKAIAAEAGLSLTPAEAWRWLAQGGFAAQTPGQARFGSFDLASTRVLINKFAGQDGQFEFEKYSIMKLNLLGATRSAIAALDGGRIERLECYRRGDRTLPVTGCYENIIKGLKATKKARELQEMLVQGIRRELPAEAFSRVLTDHLQALEAMLSDGWVQGKRDPKYPTIDINTRGGRQIRTTKAGMEALQSRKRSGTGNGTTKAE